MSQMRAGLATGQGGGRGSLRIQVLEAIDQRFELLLGLLATFGRCGAAVKFPDEQVVGATLFDQLAAFEGVDEPLLLLVHLRRGQRRQNDGRSGGHLVTDLGDHQRRILLVGRRVRMGAFGRPRGHTCRRVGQFDASGELLRPALDRFGVVRRAADDGRRLDGFVERRRRFGDGHVTRTRRTRLVVEAFLLESLQRRCYGRRRSADRRRLGRGRNWSHRRRRRLASSGRNARLVFLDETVDQLFQRRFQTRRGQQVDRRQVGGGFGSVGLSGRMLTELHRSAGCSAGSFSRIRLSGGAVQLEQFVGRQTFRLPRLVDGLCVVRDLLGDGLDVLLGGILPHQLIVQFVGVDGHLGRRRRTVSGQRSLRSGPVVRPDLGAFGGQSGQFGAERRLPVHSFEQVVAAGWGRRLVAAIDAGIRGEGRSGAGRGWRGVGVGRTCWSNVEASSAHRRKRSARWRNLAGSLDSGEIRMMIQQVGGSTRF